jgi:protein SCO1/2
MKAVCVLALFLQIAGVARAQGIVDGIGIEQRLNESVPLDLVFRDETGAQVRLGDYFGKKPVILSLVYLKCPMLCTLVLNGLVRSLRATSFDAGREFEVITVSFDPRETAETAATMKRVYMEEYRRPGAEQGWHFLTGDEASIARLTEAVGFRYKYDPESGQFAHASGIMVLTPKGRIAQYFYGLEYSARDLRLSLVESAENKIGSPVDQVLLYCFRYDPAKGKYGLVIMKALRVAGVGTVLGLAIVILSLVYRQRRNEQAS